MIWAIHTPVQVIPGLCHAAMKHIHTLVTVFCCTDVSHTEIYSIQCQCAYNVVIYTSCMLVILHKYRDLCGQNVLRKCAVCLPTNVFRVICGNNVPKCGLPYQIYSGHVEVLHGELHTPTPHKYEM